MLYCQAVFMRGSGLGTRLFPWARCRIFSHVNNIPMLSPQWVQIPPRIRPLLLGGIDLRCYNHQQLLIGLFKKRAREIGGIRRIWLQCVADKEPEPDRFDYLKNETINIMTERIIVFEGDNSRLSKLNGWDQFLYEEIRAMTRYRWLKVVDRIQDVPIGINVRRGKGFTDPKSDTDFYTRGAVRTPLPWFVESLRVIREVLGFPAKAFVVSDGTEKDLKDLLSLENVVFLRPGCAISDLLVLSKARILIASGGSSFSAWASFLGQMPTISHPGQSLTWFKLVNRKGYYVGEFDPTSPPQPFIDQIQALREE